MERNELRKQGLTARDNMEPGQRVEQSGRICGLLSTHPAVAGADHLFIYVHFRSEVQTLDLINQLIARGKTVSVPVTLLETSSLLAVRLTDPAGQLAPGCYGILEPTEKRIAEATVDPASIDTVLIPGSVFDGTGGRLGYGGGFYDRFLSTSAPQATRIGLAFSRQLVDRVPMEPHDQYMDYLVTEEQIVNCKRFDHA